VDSNIIAVDDSVKLSAKWKLELRFTGKRSKDKPYPGTLTVWESGKKLNGDGDLKAYWCMKAGINYKEYAGYGCGKVFSGDCAEGGIAVCPHCGMRWDTEQLTDSRYFVLPTSKWAFVLEREYWKVSADADIYLKYHKMDPRPVAFTSNPDTIREPRKKVSFAIYPLANIVKDSAHGSVLNEIRGFLEA